VEALQWARAHACPWDKVACEAAAQMHNHPEVMAWVRQQPE